MIHKYRSRWFLEKVITCNGCLRLGPTSGLSSLILSGKGYECGKSPLTGHESLGLSSEIGDYIIISFYVQSFDNPRNSVTGA